jgi:tetratricopeptide (TPR) repeat protein
MLPQEALDVAIDVAHQAKRLILSDNAKMERPESPLDDGQAWEKDERSYVFEERIGRGLEHKARGNDAFKAELYALALRRYARALHHAEFDVMQMHDFSEKHKDDVYAVAVPAKLNYIACVLKMREQNIEVPPVNVDDEEEPRTPLDHCDALVEEMLKAVKEATHFETPSTALAKNRAKISFRRGQLLRERGDLPRAKEALNEARNLGASSLSVRDELAKVKQLERSERERERALYAGMIQEAPIAPLEARRTGLRTSLVAAIVVLLLAIVGALLGFTHR